MTTTTRLAAQYIRMSTDKQDLSPSVQKEAIAAYATARELEIVASYEDEGRSGVHLKNRPGLLSLLRDVTQQPGKFSTVLVYDVSRWGRFQDTDAAAYHEYHCRLHEVEVVYVAEMFGSEVNPITALLKSMKRAMAAEYSRELAKKSRAGQHYVVSRGNQMGPLPALGFRRCSVSADGQKRVMLDNGQRKLSATDRVEWVVASQAELDLVRRIFDLYARARLSFSDIARLGSVEGWRDHRDRPLSRRAIALLLTNEALIGNFIWGRSRQAKSLVDYCPSRLNGAVPRIVEAEVWAKVQSRAALELTKRWTDEQMVASLTGALQRNPLLTFRDLRAQGLPTQGSLRARLGIWSDCLKQAGADPVEIHNKLLMRVSERRKHCSEFGRAFVQRLNEVGNTVVFDARLRVFRFDELRVRLRMLWPTLAESGQVWPIRFDRISRDVDLDLLVRMEDRFRAKDFFVVPPAGVVARFPHWLTAEIPVQLEGFWCRSPQKLLERLRTVTDRASLVA